MLPGVKEPNPYFLTQVGEQEQTMEATQSIGPLTPLIVCWASLLITVIGLVVAFFFTNVTAFARKLRNGRKQPASGAVGENGR